MSGRTPRPYSEREVRIADPLIRAMSALNTRVYRATNGRVGGRFLRGAPVLLLTTTGRRSGRRRTQPLLYLEDGERLVVVASKGGMPRHPAWYLNLREHPDVEVQVGREHRKLVARTASAEEKRAIWPELTAMYRDYDDYQARTQRDIPVVFLEPGRPARTGAEAQS